MDSGSDISPVSYEFVQNNYSYFGKTLMLPVNEVDIKSVTDKVQKIENKCTSL